MFLFTGIFVHSRSCSIAKVCATCSYRTMSCWKFHPWLVHWYTWSSSISVAMVCKMHIHLLHMH